MEPVAQTEGFTKIPTHIAVIMDGNGRWATSRGLLALAGHQAGTENLREIISACVEFGVRYLTIYAFSTENWGRPDEEVQGLLHILADVLDRELPELNRQGVELRHIGRLERLDPDLREKVMRAVETTRLNDRLVLSVAFNHGGRDEIVCAIRRMMEEGIPSDQVTADLVGEYLFMVRDPDLIIRTSGEMRVSNFLIWQGAYAEWYVSPKYWPDFKKEELRQAILNYGRRDRRFGRLSANASSEWLDEEPQPDVG